MPNASPGYSITVRVEASAVAHATAALTTAVSSAGGALTALDVAESHADRIVVDVTCDASDVDHADRITEAINAAGVPLKLDVAVPVDRLDELMGAVRSAVGRHGGRLVPFGHLAEGNIHVNVLDADRHVTARKVEVGVRSGQQVQIVSGLAAGDRVLVGPVPAGLTVSAAAPEGAAKPPAAAGSSAGS